MSRTILVTIFVVSLATTGCPRAVMRAMREADSSDSKDAESGETASVDPFVASDEDEPGASRYM